MGKNVNKLITMETMSKVMYQGVTLKIILVSITFWVESRITSYFMKQKLIKFFWKELFITNYIFVKFLAIFFVFKFSLKILGNETKKYFILP